MSARNLLNRTLPVVATLALAMSFALLGSAAAYADPTNGYGTKGTHSGDHNKQSAWIRSTGGSSSEGKTKPATNAETNSGPSAYELFVRYGKLWSEGKRTQAQSVLKQAWVAAGCGKYDPKKDCGILVSNSKDPDPGPSPMQTVQQVIASLGYDSPQIGVAPNHAMNHLTTRDGRALDTVVGYPTWYWAVGGTQTDKQVTKTANGMKVSLSIHPNSLTVDTGDGTALTCIGMGTLWTPQVQPRTPSPTCGHTYTKTGTYTLRITTKWTVHYVITGPGVNVSGDIPVQGSHERALVVGELQTVIVH